MPLVRGAAVTNGVYVIPAIHARLQAVFTNTAPTSTYRGAGRPEAVFIIERLIDTAAAEMGLDRMELRRRNFIAPTMLPYVSPLNTRYDSGEFAANMQRALVIADAANFAARRAEARRRGRLRGLGLSNYVETATGIPPERAMIKVLPEDRVEITLGTQASGQGHETSFAQMIVEWLGVPFDCVRAHSRRHRHRAHGLGLAFLALDAARRAAARPRRGGDHRASASGLPRAPCRRTRRP